MPDLVYRHRALLKCLLWGEQDESSVIPQPENWEYPGKMSSICPSRCDTAVLQGAFHCVWHSVAWHGTHLLGTQRVFQLSVGISEGYTVILRQHKSMLLVKGVKGNRSDENPTSLL